MVANRTVARYGMTAVTLTGAALGFVGAGLFADGLAQGVSSLRLTGYALGALGGGLCAVLGWRHREPGPSAGLAGAPASVGAVALVFATSDPTSPFFPVVLVGVALGLVGCGLVAAVDLSE